MSASPFGAYVEEGNARAVPGSLTPSRDASSVAISPQRSACFRFPNCR
jgi:hypothetical protein